MERRGAATVVVVLVLLSCALSAAAQPQQAGGNSTAAPQLQQPSDSNAAQEAAESYTHWRWGWQQFVGLGLSVLVSLISGPGGQGGASFYIPLFNVLLGFSTAEAAALASFVVFLGCISSVAQAMRKDNPVTAATAPPRRAPLIDYTTVLVFMPMLMLGVGMGVLANAVMPDWFMNVLIVTVWLWSTSKMWGSYRRTKAKEDAALAAARQAAAAAALDAATGKSAQQLYVPAQQLPPVVVAAAAAAGANGDIEVAKDAAAQQQQQQQQQQQVPAWRRWAARAAGWAAVQPKVAMGMVALLLALFVGVSVSRTFVAACSAAYWGILGAQAAYSAAFAVGVSVMVLRAARRAASAAAANGAADLSVVIVASAAEQAKPQPQPQPQTSRVERRAARAAALAARRAANEAAIIWDSAARLALYQPLMLAIGVFAGSLGLGGAAFVSPLILAAGLHPQVAAGTCKLVLMISTGGTAAAFLAARRLNVVYGLVYGLLNVVVTPLGIWLMDKLVKRTGHPSFITLLSIIRILLGIGVQIAFSMVPAFILLFRDHPPLAGFTPGAVCAAA